MTHLKVSAKQIGMYGPRQLKPGRLGGCPRSWAAWYLDMVRPVGMAPELAFGIKFHAVCAALTMTGRMPEPAQLQPEVVLTTEDCQPESVYGKMGRAAMRFLPEHYIDVPFTNTPISWISEAVWSFPWKTSQGIECDIDLRPDLVSTQHYDSPALLELVDFKSTSDKRYALTALAEDVQANLYAYGLMQRWGRERLRAHWLYVGKKPPHNAWVVKCMFKLDTCEAWLHANVDATVELIAAAREAGLSALDLPGDDTACQGRGFRCDFADRCLDMWGPKEARLISLEQITRFKEGT